MGYAAFTAWLATAFAGLYMLVVWLIENDVTSRGTAVSRLPPAVVFSHLALALSGLAVWIGYLITDAGVLAWTAVGLLAVIATLGVTMFARWIPVYRDTGPASAHGTHRGPPWDTYSGPAEGNFPVAVVACHGAFAVTTFTLVLLAALDVGG